MAQNGTPVPVPENLTEEEIVDLRKSWDKIFRGEKGYAKKNGVALFLHLFSLYPAAQDKFVQFKGLTLKELETHPKLAAHATNIMYTLASYMDNLEEPMLIDLITKTAKSHVRRGLGPEEFKWLEEPILTLVKDVAGDKPLYEQAWTKVLKLIIFIVDQESSAAKNC